MNIFYPEVLVFKEAVHVKKILYVVDDIFLFVGCALMVTGGALISPVVAIYTAAVECFLLAYLFGRVKIPGERR
jgi:hypothetical protein